jgi:hydrogenase/urease accessory protein HupE
MKYQLKAFVFFTAFFTFASTVASAHKINYALENKPVHDIAWFYLKLGFAHIIPNGLDHILFIVALCLLSTKIKTIIWQATAFTVAHTITLALSMKNIIAAPPDVVEPIIALSICFVALENLLVSGLKVWRVLLVFAFGLIHGMGFASSLNEIGLPRNQFFTSIVSFNAGVELGQIAIITLIFSTLVYFFGKKPWYKKAIVVPFSVAIALIAGFWTLERLSII